MFQVSKYRILKNAALDKRKLKENYFHFAGALSEVSSDSIKRHQFVPRDFKLSTFINFNQSGFKDGDFSGRVSGDSGEVVLTIDSETSFDISGDYCITWNMEVRCPVGEGRFISCSPFMGGQVITSAEDCFYEMGYINNINPTKTAVRQIEKYDPRAEESAVPYEFNEDEWDLYGKRGSDIKCELFSNSRSNVPSQTLSTSRGKKIHLSGVGYVNMPRSSGNIGLIVYCQRDSSFRVDAARISVRKRNR
tara:strand:- start:2786 stop:3532 length:747 start_codon:yes stop_codon:yes gene_type:complete